MDSELERRIGVLLILSSDEPETPAESLRQQVDLATVVVARAEDGVTGLRTALGEVLADEVMDILILVTASAARTHGLMTRLKREAIRQRVYHPDAQLTTLVMTPDAEQGDKDLMATVRSYLPEAGKPEGVPLSALPPHRPGTVQQLTGGREFVSRLAALGFIPGCPIEVIQNFGVGPLIVAIRDTRIALGRQEADKVRVRPGRGFGRRRRPHHWRHRRGG